MASDLISASWMVPVISITDSQGILPMNLAMGLETFTSSTAAMAYMVEKFYLKIKKQIFPFLTLCNLHLIKTSCPTLDSLISMISVQVLPVFS